MYQPTKRDSLWWDIIFISVVTSGQFNGVSPPWPSTLELWQSLYSADEPTRADTEFRASQQGLIGSTMVPVESIARAMLNAEPREYAWMNGQFVRVNLAKMMISQADFVRLHHLL